jgi:hypothetical protein
MSKAAQPWARLQQRKTCHRDEQSMAQHSDAWLLPLPRRSTMGFQFRLSELAFAESTCTRSHVRFFGIHPSDLLWPGHSRILHIWSVYKQRTNARHGQGEAEALAYEIRPNPDVFKQSRPGSSFGMLIYVSIDRLTVSYCQWVRDCKFLTW